jgi:hypothetical protein
MRCYRYYFYDEEINITPFCRCADGFHCTPLCPIIKYDENETYFYGENAISELITFFLYDKNKGMNI